jgi:hypothetical protein
MTTTPTRFAEVAARLAVNGYRPVPIAPGKKYPPLTDWQHFEFTPGCERRFAQCGAGVLLGDVVAVDVDVDDADAAAAIEHMVREVVGLGEAATAPRRIGRPPRVLLPFRASSAFRKCRSAEFSIGHVEVLAEGQQFVAFHVHPATDRPYDWNGGGDLLDVARDELPELTEEQARRIIAEADVILAEWGERIGEPRERAQGATPGERIAGGARNDTLFRFGCKLARSQLQPAEIEAALLALNAARCDPPIDAAEVRASAASAAKYARRDALERPVASARAPDVGHDPEDAPNATAADLSGSAWPDPLASEAFHGIAGEFVRMIEPNTESDPAALLVQFLIAFGALVGRGPHYRIEGTEHHANLYTLIVGATAKARKGTSWDRVREVFHATGWKPPVGGLSSGEGLKYHVRDAREETKTNKNGELVTEVVDAGVSDKRLLVYQSEFASVLRVAARDGNTLSATMREGWDSGDLRSLTKHDPVVATGAHICIVGHITADELRRELTATDAANGFGNRFLFVGARRSKLLPHGGAESDPAEVQAFADRLNERATMARQRGRIRMSAQAMAAWEGVYPELSAGGDGLHATITARADAQTCRLALLYALLDGARAIDLSHLLAALAVWTYCDATAKHIFGASLGDRIADEIMRRLRQAGDGGMTRNELRDAFGRNVSSERIGAALDLLRRRGRARCETVTTGGRPAELWRCVTR